MKLYFLRHQAQGVVHEFPFSSPPSDAQRAAVKRLLDHRHGSAHPKTKKEWWLEVVEQDVFGPGDVPKVELPGEGAPTGSGAGEFADLGASGSGVVKNPPGK